jgi:hypothetical protein
MDERARTVDEALFVDTLLGRIPGLQDWYHADADGSPWVIVSYDFVKDHGVTATLRLDYALGSIRGGWSPAFLNWDSGVRAAEAGVDLTPPDGISADGLSTSEAVDAAVEWFSKHIQSRHT